VNDFLLMASLNCTDTKPLDNLLMATQNNTVKITVNNLYPMTALDSAETITVNYLYPKIPVL
jgi:hypothetical protein